MLSKNQIEHLFERLNEKLKNDGVKGEIGIVGGAVMCLVFNARQSTKDIDGIFVPTSKIREFIREISEEEGIDRDWLNDGAKGYIQGDFKRVNILSLSNLNVWAPEAKYMLAMKCISARIDTSDKDDVIFLIKRLGLKRAEDVLDIISKYYPKQLVPVKTQYFLEELFEG